jgi:hypothetical protein
MKHTVLLVVLCSLAPSTVSAQSNFFQTGEARVRADLRETAGLAGASGEPVFDDRAVGED